MSKEPKKIEETATSYTTKNPADTKGALKPSVPTADDATFKKVTDKIFSERKELLHKLAQ